MKPMQSMEAACPACGDKDTKMVCEVGILCDGNTRMYKLRCYHCGKQFWHGVKEK